MTLEHGAAEAEVKIRAPRHAWVSKLPIAACWFVFAAAFLWIDHLVFFAVFWLALGGAQVGSVLWQWTLGVDLTQESAIVRSRRQRRIPWQEVQAVVRYGRRGARGVRLILESGKPVNLLAPTSTLGLGAAQFERDFNLIDQWWLAHRGESWRPVRAETPPPPVQG